MNKIKCFYNLMLPALLCIRTFYCNTDNYGVQKSYTKKC